jgi:chromosome segregation ATPase
MASTKEMGLAASSSAQARKRRIQRRAKQKNSNEDDTSLGGGVNTSFEANANKKMRLADEIESVSSGFESESTTESTAISKEKLSAIPGIKKKARYVPLAPMNKEQLKEWRKEARRVRNRESAAASRQKTRQRIEELESELGDLNNKYQAALRRIAELEAAAISKTTAATAHQEDDFEEQVYSTPPLQPHTVSPPMTPRDSFSLDYYEDGNEEQQHHDSEVAPKYQHVIDSRPNACVKILIGLRSNN